MKDFSRGLKLDPNNERYSGAEAYLYMGMIKFEKGDLKEAKKFFSRAVKLEPALILMDGVWQFAKDVFLHTLEYLYETEKEAQKQDQATLSIAATDYLSIKKYRISESKYFF
jgi:tetratricopeptide (TPR) repeat protein